MDAAEFFVYAVVLLYGYGELRRELELRRVLKHMMYTLEEEANWR